MPARPSFSTALTALLLLAGGTLSAQELSSQSDAAEGERIVAGSGCGVCHAGLPVDPRIRSEAPRRRSLSQEEALAFLTESHRPAYPLTALEARSLAAYWARDPSAGEALPAPGGTPAPSRRAGEALYRVYGCGECHDEAPGEDGEEGAPGGLAPSLADAGHRLQPEWLRGFLADPGPVRPAGFRPGTRSLMPDFGLSDAEVEAVVAYLATLSGEGRARPVPEPLTPWGTQRAERYLTDRLSCLGCHQWRDQGGLIGPPLDGLSDRLTPEAVVAAVLNPASRGSHSVMPRSPFRADIVEEVVSLLVHDTATWRRVSAEPEIPWDQQVVMAEALVGDATRADPAGYLDYQRRCAQCHGTRGDGGGYNARYLPVSPTAHVDATHMSTRPDDPLYDGIAAGGWVLDKSHRMPAFGRSLPSGTMRRLVSYMRLLCDCEGPTWSVSGGGR